MRGTGRAERGAVGSSSATSILVHVQPRAKQTEIVGWHGDAIRIRVAAPPVEGAANDELVRFLAERLELSRSQVQLASGPASRRKRVHVSGLTPDQVLARLSLT